MALPCITETVSSGFQLHDASAAHKGDHSIHTTWHSALCEWSSHRIIWPSVSQTVFLKEIWNLYWQRSLEKVTEVEAKLNSSCLERENSCSYSVHSGSCRCLLESQHLLQFEETLYCTSDNVYVCVWNYVLFALSFSTSKWLFAECSIL